MTTTTTKHDLDDSYTAVTAGEANCLVQVPAAGDVRLATGANAPADGTDDYVLVKADGEASLSGLSGNVYLRAHGNTAIAVVVKG